MYFIIGAFAGVLGTVMSIYIRMELLYPSVQVLSENQNFVLVAKESGFVILSDSLIEP